MSRPLCLTCRKAAIMCYCKTIEPFSSQPQFVILLHPKESRKAINTGRMAWLHLNNARLMTDSSFDDHEPLRKLLDDPGKRCHLLFPGPNAQDIATWKNPAAPSDQEDVFLILDATWSMARSMYRKSRCLQALPQVMFHPPKPSEFIIRKQPHVDCFSTIETIHHIIELMGTHPAREHDRLLLAFRDMVQKQIDFELQQDSALRS
jgi:DTW domain-containing protein YfiP